MVLDGAGRVRWNRVENLVAESAKAMHSNSGEQLWLVAQWLLGAPGAAMRAPLAAEVARLLDAVVAGACGAPDLARVAWVRSMMGRTSCVTSSRCWAEEIAWQNSGGPTWRSSTAQLALRTLLDPYKECYSSHHPS